MKRKLQGENTLNNKIKGTPKKTDRKNDMHPRLNLIKLLNGYLGA
jgi:hypothetical protein